MSYTPVIGLEIHLQLATATKMFCGCSAAFGGGANTRTCPVCLGFPGALPVPNEQAVVLATRLALALGATVQRRSAFDRKSYIYPDLPKGYQITQQVHPIATGGAVPVGDRAIPLRRLHLEEDAGKSSHGPSSTTVDLNRAGVPLVELVTEPALRSPAEAAAFMKQVRRIVRYLGVSDGNMEQGSLRCDANVSLRRADAEEPGARVELKNINSFRFVSQALEHEIARHAELLDAGERVPRETRLFDARRGVTVFMRSKEDDQDYRYFPEPDLPPLVLDEALLSRAREGLVELAHERAARWQRDWDLRAKDAAALSADRATAEWFEAAVDALGVRDTAQVRTLANLMLGEVARRLNDAAVLLADLPFGPARLAQLVGLIADGTLSVELARKVLGVLWTRDADPSAIADEHGWRQVSDDASIDPVIRAVLADHPAELRRLRAGKTKLKGFFVGQVMKRTRGTANPGLVSARLDALLAEQDG